MKRGRILTALLLGGALIFGAGPVLAQDYGPITEPVNECVTPRDGDGNVTTVFAQGGDIQATGVPGCFGPTEEGIEGILASDPVTLFVFTANADGGYDSPTATVPSDFDPGRHTLTVRSADGDPVYTQNVTITAAGAAGRLPRTGGDIALLALWGVGLLIFGTLLVSATWRKWRAARFEAVLAREAEGVQTLSHDDIDWGNFRPAATTWIDRDDSGPAQATAVLDAPADTGGDDHDVLEDTSALARIDDDFAPAPEPTAGSVTTVDVEAEADHGYPSDDEPEVVHEPMAYDAPETTWTPNGEVADEPTEPAPRDVGEAVERAQTRTSELVDRLREELKAWERPEGS